MKTEKLSLEKLRLCSGGCIISSSPLRIRRDEQDLCMVLEEEAEGHLWKETDYLLLDMEASGRHKVTVSLFFEDDAGERLLIDTAVIPGQRILWAVPLSELKSERWFFPASPGTYKGHVRGKPTHIDRIHRIRMLVSKGIETTSFVLHSLQLTALKPDQTVSGEPLIDEFGQRIDLEWQGKIHCEQQLKKELTEALLWAEKNADYPFPDWNIYGGYKKKKFEGTGFFRTEFAQGRWWLVDPEGCAYFSNGLCYGNRFGTFAQVKGMESLFRWIPPLSDSKYMEAWANISVVPEFVKRNGMDACKDRFVFNFARANMIRVFGDQWKQAWTKISTARMKNWGFNHVSVSVNNYDDESPLDFLKEARMPYTWALKKFPKTSTMIFRDLPDVFSEEYQDACADFARQAEEMKNDPFLIGYFITNEPEWTVERSVNPARLLLSDTRETASRQALLGFIREKYQTIQALNTAWECNLSDFKQIGRCTINRQAAADLDEFCEILKEKYIRTPYDAIRKADPNHLILGIRYAGISEEYITAADEICEVFSVNGYKRDSGALCDLAQKSIHKPLLLTEWHFGGNGDRLYSNALINADGQKERGLACRNYLETVMAHPQCIGAVYFELNDEPALGTYDGQALQDGLVDVCNRPYEDCVAEMKKAAEKMYPLMCGNCAAESIQWKYFERV